MTPTPFGFRSIPSGHTMMRSGHTDETAFLRRGKHLPEFFERTEGFRYVVFGNTLVAKPVLMAPVLV